MLVAKIIVIKETSRRLCLTLLRNSNKFNRQRWARNAKTQQCLEGLGHEMDSAYVDKHEKILF